MSKRWRPAPIPDAIRCEADGRRYIKGRCPYAFRVVRDGKRFCGYHDPATKASRRANQSAAIRMRAEVERHKAYAEVGRALREKLTAELEEVKKVNAFARLMLTMAKQINEELGHPGMPVDGMQPLDYIKALKSKAKRLEEERDEARAARDAPAGAANAGQAPEPDPALSKP